MKKSLLLFIVTLFMGSGLFAQCPPGSISFNSQAQVNDFIANYPNCTAINGNLIINGGDISNLMPLSNITSISGDLDIRFTTMLSDLDGLHNLTSVGGLLFVENNNALTSIASLNSLNTIGQIIIRSNPLLTSILGFGSLATVNNNLSITDNPALAIISGFNALSTIDIIDITNNALLTSIPDFGSLTTVNNLLNINNNPALAIISGFNALSTVGSTLAISNNAMLASIPDFGSLTTVNNDLSITDNPALAIISGFNPLSTVGSTLDINNNTALVTISGFNALNTVGNTLVIKNNAMLASISGFGSPGAAASNNVVGGAIQCFNNPSLMSITGFNNFTSTVNDVAIFDNQTLSTISGFSNLNSVNTLFIKGNPALVTPPGLDNITTVNNIEIRSNNAMTSLPTFNSLNTISGTVTITNNGSLSTCNSNWLCIYINSNPNAVIDINNNASGCNSLSEVTNHCICPPGDVIITSQAQINDFATNYPNCTAINGNLSIQGGNISNLMPFSNINSVSGGIDIQFTAMLNDLDGLHNLTSVGGLLFVENNNALTSIASLNSLNTIGQIIIRFNPLLTSILGFGSLATVNNNLSITDNPALAIISGFNALSTIDIIDITNNALLTSIPDFGSLTTVNNLLNINNNTALVTISGFNALNTVGNTLVIKNNAMLASISGFGSPGAAASNNVVGGAIQCFNNPSLMSITGFNNFTSTVNDVAIFDNQTLSTISGFSNLNSVNTLFIKGNPALVTPPGLDNISMVNNIEIRSNNALTSLSTLNNLSTISGNVTIVDNSNLAACNSTWLCNVINNASINFNITNNATGCNSKAEVSNSCTPALMAICKNATVSLNANGQASIQVADVNNGSVGATMATVSPSTFNCSNLGANTVTLTVTDASGNTDQCTSTVTVSTGVGLPNSWQGGAVGVPQSPPPVLNFSACNGNTPTGQFTIGGSSNNATTSTTDNITFAYQTICGTNSSITVKVETVSSGGYGGLMIRESSMPGAKQVAVFSNLTNSLRHEVRYMNNGPKVVQNFMKPNPIWLRLKRMGTWVFAEYSFNGVTFQPVHAVNVPMQNCVQVGMAAFSFIPGQQATATFSNVTTTGTVVPIAIEEGPAQEDKRTGESLSLFEEQIENDVTLFPNPASTHINLQFERPTVATTRITILNPLGQVSSTSILPRGVEREVFDVQGYAPGMYVLRVENEELNEVIPFIISR